MAKISKVHAKLQKQKCNGLWTALAEAVSKLTE